MPRSRRALITGGTGLIGRAVAQALGDVGYSVILNYSTDEERATTVLRHLREDGTQASLQRADVSEESAVARLFEAVLREGPLDVLVNAVGRFHFESFLETTPDEWDAVLASNLRTSFLCCRAALPHMRSAGSGAIVNVASMNAQVLRAKPKTLPYAIAKAGVILLTKTLAATEAEFGIRVNAVSPGFVRGGGHPPRHPEKTIPLRREAEPAEIAEAVRFLVSDDAVYITGAVLDVHGGAFL